MNPERWARRDFEDQKKQDPGNTGEELNEYRRPVGGIRIGKVEAADSAAIADCEKSVEDAASTATGQRPAGPVLHGDSLGQPAARSTVKSSAITNSHILPRPPAI